MYSLKCQLRIRFCRSLVWERRRPIRPLFQSLIRCIRVAPIDFFVDSNAFKIKLYPCDRLGAKILIYVPATAFLLSIFNWCDANWKNVLLSSMQ